MNKKNYKLKIIAVINIVVFVFLTKLMFNIISEELSKKKIKEFLIGGISIHLPFNDKTSSVDRITLPGVKEQITITNSDPRYGIIAIQSIYSRYDDILTLNDYMKSIFSERQHEFNTFEKGEKLVINGQTFYKGRMWGKSLSYVFVFWQKEEYSRNYILILSQRKNVKDVEKKAQEIISSVSLDNQYSDELFSALSNSLVLNEFKLVKNEKGISFYNSEYEETVKLEILFESVEKSLNPFSIMLECIKRIHVSKLEGADARYINTFKVESRKTGNNYQVNQYEIITTDFNLEIFVTGRNCINSAPLLITYFPMEYPGNVKERISKIINNVKCP